MRLIFNEILQIPENFPFIRAAGVAIQQNKIKSNGKKYDLFDQTGLMRNPRAMQDIRSAKSAQIAIL